MKLTSVEIHPPSNADELVLSFRDPTALNPYNAVSIEGLDSDLVVPKYYGTDQESKLYNLMRKKRTVVIQIGLNPNYAESESYFQLRDDLYRLVSAARGGEVQLHFKNNSTVVAAISGFILKLETDHFDRDQEVKLTIECRDPMLKSLAPVNVDFDISNPGLLILEDNVSTAPHGFSFIAEFNSTLTEFGITNESEGFSFIIRPRDLFFNNDVLHFSSEFNNKYLYVVRDSVVTHLGDVIDLNPIWPIIFPGTNEYSISNHSYVFWHSISHYETYWGV